MTKVLKSLDLDLKDIPSNRKKQAKREVLNYLENEIQRNVSKGKSPVQGEASFLRLNANYSKNQKQGNTIANLQLEGDLMDALEFNDKAGSVITVGYSETNPEIEKADGHNQFSAEAKKQFWGQGENRRKKLPKRRFIPDRTQSFKKGIMNGIDRILNDFREAPDDEVREQQEVIRISEDEEQVGVDVNAQTNIFGDENIVELLRREFLKGQDGF